MLRKGSLFRLALCCRIPVHLFVLCLPFPVPFPCPVNKCLLKMPLTDLSTSTVLVAMTTHKNNHFQGDCCPLWACSNVILTQGTWCVPGGSGFLRLEPYFWLIISKPVQCKALPVPLLLLPCQLSAILGVSLLLCEEFCSGHQRTHPWRASCPGAEHGAAPSHCTLLHSFTHGEEPCQELSLWSCYVSSFCAPSIAFSKGLSQVWCKLVRREEREHFPHAALQHAAVKLVLGT